MRGLLFFLIVTACGQAALAQEASHEASPAAIERPAPPKRIAKILSKADGLTKETAYKVSNMGQEYEILGYLGLEPRVQSLIIDKKAYDRFTTVDLTTGAERVVWFDISSYFGRMF